MGAHHFPVPGRPRHEHGDPAHAGTIIPTQPDEIVGTDALLDRARGLGAGSLGAVDHFTAEVMGWHVEKIGERWAVLVCK
jgi:hypothetical protein